MTRRHSLATIVVYWFALLAGLAIYTVTRTDEVDLAGLWIGVVGGTAFGQFLAARDLRLWFVAVVLAAFVVLCGPFTPTHENGLLFWMAMIPATMCGWLSLSDRGSLLAFWFPVVVWMLSILDRGKGALAFTSSSAALLAGLAFMFIAFLYARETRRVGMWRTIAPTPIAPETAPVILKEVPRLRIGLTGWSLAVSSLAFGICAWLAPRLWKVEPLVPDLYATSTNARPDRPSVRCCRDMQQLETKRARVKEYFDIGRGHDEDSEEESFEGECVVCGPDGLPLDASRYGRYDDGWAYGDRPHLATGPGYGGYGDGYVAPYRHGTPGSGDGTGPGTGAVDGYASGNGTGDSWGNAYNPSYSSKDTPAAPPSYTPPTPPSYTPPVPSYTPETPSYTPPSYTPETPSYTPPSYTPPPSYIPPTPPSYTATPHYPPTAPSYTPPPPSYTPPTTPPQTDVPRADVRADTASPSPSPSAASTTVGARAAAGRTDGGPPVVYWLVILLAGGFAFQLLALGMRPVRRLITLRHLRRPFWNETVDQRISNWWHLVLVGLRDAGWRTTTGEAPRELARRLDLDGVERAAAILERARHGVGIDAADLAEMADVSEQAYRASRERTTRFARLLGWFRRPLV